MCDHFFQQYQTLFIVQQFGPMPQENYEEAADGTEHTLLVLCNSITNVIIMHKTWLLVKDGLGFLLLLLHVFFRRDRSMYNCLVRLYVAMLCIVK